jgi:COMPASS component SPP1
MILCDECEDWFHPACIQMDDSVVAKVDRAFKCPACACKRPKIG